MTLAQRILRRAFIAVTWRPVLTIVVALALSGLSIFYTVGHLGFLTSQKDLVSPGERLMQLSAQLDEFEDFDTFVVAIENQDPARALGFLHALTPILEADREHYLDVFYRVDPSTLKRWALLYLDKDDLGSLEENIRDHERFIQSLTASPGLNTFCKLINDKMSSQMVGELFTGFLDDKPLGSKENPFDLSFLINTLNGMLSYLDNRSYTSPWGSFFSKASWDEDAEGYFWSAKKRYLLFFVTPAKIDNSFNKAQASLDALRKTIARVKTDFPDIQVGVTGQQALNVDEMTLALKGMGLATGLSIACLTLLLIFFWRGVRRPLLEMLELLVALALTFGLTTLVVGHLNILSIVFAPLLLGLGIDYGIHWLARYQEEEEKRAASRKEALQTTMIQLGPGILLAGMTAALSFFPLVLTGFKGLAELGVISSMGMVMTTLTTLCVLPALTLVFDKPTRRTLRPVDALQSKPFLRMTDRRAFLILAVSFVGLVISAILAKEVRFDLNMLRLQSKGAESVVWEMKLLDGSERSSLYGAVLAHSIQEVHQKSEALKALPSVSEVDSIESLLPEDQEEKADILRRIEPLLPSIRPAGGDMRPVDLQALKESLAKISFKMLDSSKSDWGARTPIEDQMIQVRNIIAQLQQRLDSPEKARVLKGLDAFQSALMADMNDKIEMLYTNVSQARPMQLSDLPQNLLQRFVGKGGLYLIRVFPAQNVWEPDLLGRFVHDLRTVDPDVVGDPVTLYEFTKAFRDACIRAAIYAVIFISALLLLTFRSAVFALLAMLPLVVGTAWTFGLMRCFGVNLNLANSVFLPLIVGAGVEYGIIILQRWKQGGNGKTVLPSSTGRGVILAGLTTTVGFGSLMAAAHRGIYSLGLLATLGSLSVLAAALLFLPAVLQLLTSYSTKWAPKSMDIAAAEKLEGHATLEKERV